MWTWMKRIVERVLRRRQGDDYGQRLVDGYGLER